MGDVKKGVSRRAFALGAGSLLMAGACTQTTNGYEPVQPAPNNTKRYRVYSASYSPEDDMYYENAIYTKKITGIYVRKGRRKMYLMSGQDVVKEYDIELGWAPQGAKRVQGDGKTPEGTYYIDRRNPQSQFYLSLGISYPNSRDRATASRLGRSAGGDIMIHGDPTGGAAQGGDWTNGCIAVTNGDMDELWRIIPIGTPITISA